MKTALSTPVKNYPISDFLHCSPTKAEREQSRRRMDESYKQMMELYADQQKELSKRPNWIGSKVKGAMEPSDMTVTHVNQTRDLLVRFWKPEPMFHNSLNRYLYWTILKEDSQVSGHLTPQESSS